jgi:hypothetical protein
VSKESGRTEREGGRWAASAQWAARIVVKKGSRKMRWPSLDW